MIVSPLLALMALASLPGQGGSVADLPTQEFLGWRGWSYLNGAGAVPGSLYPSQSALPSTPPSTEGTVWKTKVFVFRSTERIGRDTDGVLRSDRQTIEDPQMALLRAALQRLATHVSTVTGNKVRLDLDVTEEPETLRDNQGDRSFGASFLQKFLGDRLNGGGYEAEDKVFRGPYNSVFAVLPGASSPTDDKTNLYGMPVTAITLERIEIPDSPRTLDAILRATWIEQLKRRAQSRGYEGITSEETGVEAAWPDLTDFTEPSGSILAERAKSRVRFSNELLAMPDLGQGWRTAAADASVVSDPERGSVLKVSLKGRSRSVGLALPQRSDNQALAKVVDNHTLNLKFKTLSKDPVAIRLQGEEGKKAWIVLGPEIATAEDPDEAILIAPVRADGTWQTVAIDFSALAKRAEIGEVQGLAIEFSPRARKYARAQLEPVEVTFDDIRFSNDATSGLDTSVSEVAVQAKMASAATASSPELIALLSSASPLVRLNAADAYTRFTDPAAEAGLTSIVYGLDQIAAERALTALSKLGTDTAKDAIRRATKTALGDYTKAVAAKLLGETKEARVGGDLSILLSSRSWQTRLAAVRALRLIPGREASILRLAFLAQDNPDIKLEVTESIDAKDEPVVRRLLWSVVNEPLDKIRAMSALKLVQSPLPEIKKEGYAAVRDDSRTVRRLLLEGLAASPDEGHREAFRLGIADVTPSVRAAAVAGFATLEKGASEEELAPAFEDAHPVVQLALIQYARKRTYRLPAVVMERLRSSPFAEVKRALEGLPG